MVAINQREVLLCCKPRDFGNLIFIYVDQRDGSFGYHLLNIYKAPLLPQTKRTVPLVCGVAHKLIDSSYRNSILIC